MKQLLVLTLFFLVTSSPAFAQKGYLFIESAPDSALVTIDGRHIEKYYTPVLCTLSVGEHSIEISKRFYESEMFKVKIEPEAVVRKRVDFVRQEKFKVTKPTEMTVEGKYGQLTIITNPLGAKVLADGKDLSMTSPVTLSNVPAGPHRYSIVYHYIQYDTVIIVTGDAPQSVVIDLRHFEGKEMYSVMPRVETKVVIEVPGCEYKLDEATGLLSIKGVDAEIIIRTGDSSLTLTLRELADFPNKSDSTIESKNNKSRHPKKEYTYNFQPFLDAKLRFEFITFASKKTHQPKFEIRPQRYYHHFPASLNSGKPVNVRILIEEDGEIVFRYW